MPKAVFCAILHYFVQIEKGKEKTFMNKVETIAPVPRRLEKEHRFSLHFDARKAIIRNIE